MPFRGTARTTRTTLHLVIVLCLLLGCDSSDEQPSRLPDATTLLAKSADRLRALRSVELTFSVNGKIPGFAVLNLDATAKANGWAAGTVELQRELQNTEYEFTLRDGTVHLSDDSDDRTTRPVPSRYRPQRLFDGETGIRRLLTSATGLRTETRESLDDTTTFRVTGKLSEHALAAFVPSAWGESIVKFWVAEDRHVLRRVWIQLPPRRPNAGVVAIELALSEHNALAGTDTTTKTAATTTPTSSS